MEQSSRNSITGPSEIPISSMRANEKSAWRLPDRTSAYHAPTDVSLFSTSLPVLPHEKLNFNESNHGGKSFDDDFPSLSKVLPGAVVKDPMEGTDPDTVLPDDEDELFAGIMDDFDLSGLPSQLEELDDDFFGSGGGLEIESESRESLVNGLSRLSMSDDINGSSISQYSFTNGAGTVSGEHPYGEHPSRTLFVRNINSNVEDSELRALFEQYGDIRTLYTACKHRGFVMISYYDIRSARTAMRGLQNKSLRRRRLDIHFSIPKDNPSEKDMNQGTLVVFNLDASVSNDYLREIFGAYGEVKEIRETPHKRHHKFIEFYDVRAADAALKALNRSDIAGKRIKLEPSRPGGARRSLMQQLTQDQEQDEARGFQHQVGSPIGNSPPGSWPNFGSPVEQNALRFYSHSPNMGSVSPVGSNSLTGLASILPSHISNPVKIAPIGKDPARMSHGIIPNVNTTHASSLPNQYSFPDPKPRSSPGPISPLQDPKQSSVGTLSGPQFLWGSPTIHEQHISSSAMSSSLNQHINSSAMSSSLNQHINSSAMSSSRNQHINSSAMSASLNQHISSAMSSLSNRRSFLSSEQRVGFPYTSQHGSLLGSNFHVGSAPSGIPLEKHFGFLPESPETSYINRAAFGATNFARNNGNHAVNAGAMNMGVNFAANFSESGSPSSRMMSMPRNGPVYIGSGSFGSIGSTSNDGFVDRARGRRADTGSQMDKKQYQLDLEKISNCEDSRTTLMIKNIPNKYTSKMLLAAIDETHKGTYDFLYLPIDFKNKCNVGYAFINMVSPSHIVTFYEAFNGKRWEKFNSEKVASLAYARIQGKTALISHFQNSSLMNEDKRCRPILFQSEGQGTGELECLHSGNLNIFIRQPDGSYVGDSIDSPRGDPDDERL